MAIFSRTQIPKYQNPIRITRPYIKPNYLADTINSAIQGYGSIQNTNMQRQLFNAKLKAAADAKAQNERDQVTYRQMMSNAAPTQQLEMFYEGQDPSMGGGPAMGPHSEMTTQPGMSQMESIMAAMQSNPGARVQDLIAMAGGINKLQNPTVKGGPSDWQLYRENTRLQEKASKVDTQLQTRRGTTVTKILGEEFGSLLEGTEAEIAARFEPSTKPVHGERSWDRPETWGFGDREIGTVTTGESGPLKLRAFVGRRVRDMATWMLNNGYDAHDVRMVMARMKEAAMASGKFDFVAAWGAVPSEIAENIGQPGRQNQGGGTTSQRARGHNVTLPNS